MKQFILRLDDASDYMDIDKWKRLEAILDEFSIKPIVGIIPKNEDPSLVSKYEKNPDFWNLVHSWIRKGWVPAMHGYEHKYVTKDGGINPVNHRSEFAGLPYEEQAEKIRRGYKLLLDHGIKADIFFAPSHTFDRNTLKALYMETEIRVISDTIANDVYYKDHFHFIPQQSGKARKLPFQTVTLCYHPNIMEDLDYENLRRFFMHNGVRAVTYNDKLLKTKKKSVYDGLLSKVYFMIRAWKARM